MRGTSIGEYELVELLGEGTFGTVWKAKHRNAEMYRAIKVAKEPGLIEQFRTEAEVLEAVNHPHIVRVHDLITSRDTPSVVLEYVEGGDLQSALREGPLPWRRAVQIAAQVLDALGAAHEAGLLHRDVKPSNILLTEEGRVKVADFGLVSAAERTGTLAISRDDPSVADELRGTLPYMAPETLEGAGPSPQSDIFSVGVALYRAMTGSIPRGFPKPPSQSAEGCPEALDAPVMTLLAGDPADRPTSAADARAMLQSVLGETGAAEGATIQVRGEPEGTQIYVDGDPAGQAPCDIAVELRETPVRAVQLQAAKEGYRQVAVGSITCEAGQTLRWDYRFPARLPAGARFGLVNPPSWADIAAVAFSPDGTTLAAGGKDRTVSLWDTSTGQRKGALEHAEAITALAYCPSNGVLVSAAHSDIKVWDVENSKPLTSITDEGGWVRSLAINRSGMVLAAGNSNGQVTLWEPGDGRQMDILEGHARFADVRALAFTSKGNTLASGADDGQLLLWDTTMCPFSSPKLIRKIRAHHGLMDRLCFGRYGTAKVTCAAFNRTGLLAYGSEGSLLPNRLWKLVVKPLWDWIARREGLRRSLARLVRRTLVVYDPDSRKAFGVGGAPRPAGLPIRLWNEWGYIRPTSAVKCVAFIPGSSNLVADGDFDSDIAVWDWWSQDRETPLKEPTGYTRRGVSVQCIDVSPDGKLLATGLSDGTVTLWNLATNKPAAKLWNIALDEDGTNDLEPTGEWVAWTPGGYYDGSPGAEKHICLRAKDGKRLSIPGVLRWRRRPEKVREALQV